MMNKSFDNLTRRLGKTPTRRHALKLLAGTALAGLLRFTGLRRSSAKTNQGQIQTDSPLQINLATTTEIEQFMAQAEQNADFVALRAYFSGFGFVRDKAEGARAIINGILEVKIVTEILINTQQPGTRIQLTNLEFPRSVYLPIVMSQSNENSAGVPELSSPSSSMLNNKTISYLMNGTLNHSLAYSVTLDSNGLPIVGHYRNQNSEVVTEFPPTATNTATYAIPNVISPQDDKCQQCKDGCKSGITNNKGAESICNWSLSLTCYFLGFFAVAATEGLAASAAAAIAAGCALAPNAVCSLFDPVVDCDTTCEKVCKDCSTSVTRSPYVFTGESACVLGDQRVMCGGRLCAPTITSCTTLSDGSEICTPPDGVCQPNYHYVGHYRFGSGSAPFCCFDGGINCGARPDGFWGGCCPGNTRCVPEGIGYACRF